MCFSHLNIYLYKDYKKKFDTLFKLLLLLIMRLSLIILILCFRSVYKEQPLNRNTPR